MEVPNYLYRCWSPASVGGLESGKMISNTLDVTTILTDDEVDDEFFYHQNPWNRIPTGLVSTTSNFWRALHIAFRFQHEGEDDCDIVLAFISPNKQGTTRVHHGFDLAEWAKNTRSLPTIDPRHFKNEWLYEVQIPENHVIHTVSLATVLARGFSLTPLKLNPDSSFPNLEDFLACVRVEIKEPFDRGFACGLAAFDFGPRAPSREIAVALADLPLDRSKLNHWQEMVLEGIDSAIVARWLDVFDLVEDNRRRKKVVELEFETEVLRVP